MAIRLHFASLRETTPTEYVRRFLYGGTVTVLASLIAKRYGPVIGGLFLAFPGIFSGGIGLVEKHKIAREAKQGQRGLRSGRAEAAVEATGASIGAVGLVVFGFVLWQLAPRYSFALTLLLAIFAWLIVSYVVWRTRERL